MAAVAAVRHEPVVHAQAVQIGEVKIPIGRIQTSCIYRKDHTGKEIHEVRVWTQGGMGLKGKDVIIDFQLQTAERANQFFQDLLAKAGASFSLNASLIRPDLVASGEGVRGVIDIHFPEGGNCGEFDSTIAPVFFPLFQRQVLNDGRTLTLTSAEGTAAEITQVMNQSLAALNAQTHLRTGELLYRNGDPRFYGKRNQELTACSAARRDPRYLVALDGTVQKEASSIYSAPKPLPLPTEKKRAGMEAGFALFIETATALSKVSDGLAKEIVPCIEYVRKLAKEDRRNPVDWEVLANSMSSLTPQVNDDLTEEEWAAFQRVMDDFGEKVQKIEEKFQEYLIVISSQTPGFHPVFHESTEW